MHVLTTVNISFLFNYFEKLIDYQRHTKIILNQQLLLKDIYSIVDPCKVSMRLVDSHCHLDRSDYDYFQKDLSQLLNFAREQGVIHFFCVSIDLKTFPTVLALKLKWKLSHAEKKTLKSKIKKSASK